ncbi:class I SAM-dependent methyltransferase [candidate division WOR-3 bacterium]|nr:class I SAM-dependent methyltransferase [candidate division WOR-3 bacterium]
MRKKLSDKDIALRWDAGAKVWARTVRAGGDIYREEVNNPAFFKFLGPIKGKKVLDLGCGEGYNTKILAKKGAKITGIDFSKELIKLTIDKEEKEKLGIKYYCQNAADLSIFKDNSFDVVVSFMALMDTSDLQSAFKEVRRVLKPEGRFVFSILHPCFNRWKLDLGWEKDKDGNPLYYKIDNYFDEGQKEIIFTLVWDE